MHHVTKPDFLTFFMAVIKQVQWLLSEKQLSLSKSILSVFFWKLAKKFTNCGHTSEMTVKMNWLLNAPNVIM